jgi:hypothetical protein
MEVGQDGQVGRLVHVPVAWVLLHVQGGARIQLPNLAASLALASPKRKSLVKTLIVVSTTSVRILLQKAFVRQTYI